jgi:hypothetical protein
VLTRKVGSVFLFNKKAYLEGQAVFTKVHSMVVGSVYKFSKSIYYFRLAYSYLCRRSKMIDSYWYRVSKALGFVHNFTFKNVVYDDRFHRLINTAAFYWTDFKVILSLFLQTASVLHVVFFFHEFLKVPFHNVRLRDKGVDAWSKELARLLRKGSKHHRPRKKLQKIVKPKKK